MNSSTGSNNVVQRDASPAIMAEMIQRKVEEIMLWPHPIQIHWLVDGAGSGYFYVFLVDFGHSACSATGDTIEEALANLVNVKRDVIRFFLETDHPIPKPSRCPADL